MKLYLCMVLGGSACTLLYIIFNHLLPFEFSVREKNIYLKINILFYLLPIPWIAVEIKGFLKVILEMIGITFPENKEMYIEHINNIWESVIIMNENNEIVYITGYEKWLPFIWTAFTLFLVLTFGWIITYLTLSHKYRRKIIYIDFPNDLNNNKSRKRKIQIGMSPYVSSPIAMGVLKPVILLPLNDEKYANSTKGIICHELKHIQNMDGIFRFLSYVVIAIEWYNPLAYYLFHENITVNELLCDNVAVENMSKEEKICYMNCIIAAVEQTKNAETVLMALGAKRGLSRERINRIMKENEKKVWKNGFAITIIAFSFLISSIPALAYKEPRMSSYAESENIEDRDWENIDCAITVFGEECMPFGSIIEDFRLGDYVFTNAKGEMYPFEESILSSQGQIKLSCIHNFEAGTYSEHKKNGDNSCEVINYRAQLCTKCGYKKTISEISSTIYKVCPH